MLINEDKRAFLVDFLEFLGFLSSILYFSMAIDIFHDICQDLCMDLQLKAKTASLRPKKEALNLPSRTQEK